MNIFPNKLYRLWITDQRSGKKSASGASVLQNLFSGNIWGSLALCPLWAWHHGNLVHKAGTKTLSLFPRVPQDTNEHHPHAKHQRSNSVAVKKTKQKKTRETCRFIMIMDRNSYEWGKKQQQDSKKEPNSPKTEQCIFYIFIYVGWC